MLWCGPRTLKYGVGPSIVPRQLGAVGLPKSWVVNRAGRNWTAKDATSLFLCLVRLVVPLVVLGLVFLLVLVCLLLAVLLLAVVLRRRRSTRATWDVWCWVFFCVCGRHWWPLFWNATTGVLCGWVCVCVSPRF